MKRILFYSSVILLVALTSGTGTGTGEPIKWKEIESRLMKIKEEVDAATTYTKVLAWFDDHEEAQEIAEEFESQSTIAVNIFKEAKSLISSKSLTPQKTLELFEKFQEIVVQTKQFIENADISLTRQKQIRPFHTDLATNSIKFVKEIIQILDGVYNFNAINYYEIDNRLFKIRDKIKATFKLVNSIAWLDNRKLSMNLDDVAITCENLLNEAYAINANKSLTSKNIEEMESFVNTQLTVVRSNLNREDLKKLSPVSQKEIKDAMADAISTISLNFKEMGEILFGHFVFPIDWDVVYKLVWKIQDELYTLMPNIGIAAMKDTKRKELHEKISDIVDINVHTAVGLLEDIKLKAQTKQLTINNINNAKSLISEKLSLIKKEIRELVAKLSPDRSKEIRNFLSETHNTIEEIVFDITALLSQKTKTQSPFEDEDDVYEKDEL